MEPPGDRGGQAPAGGTSGGGAGGAGGGGGTGGFNNPQGGSGGLNPAAGTGGAAGMGVTGGMGAGGSGGAAGFGGAGGEAGSGTDADAGVDSGADPEAPVLDCEQGRDTVMLLEALLAGPAPYCSAQLPNSALEGGPMALAVTSLEEGSGAETAWAVRKNGADECDEGDAFYVDLSLAVPRVTLCPAFCEALVATGVENVKLELIYGCESPE